MGGTKSHKIPFWELAKGLINRWVFKDFFNYLKKVAENSVSLPRLITLRGFSKPTLVIRVIISVLYSGHNITFLSGFPADFHVDGLVEITPTSFVQYIQNYTNWDLLGEWCERRNLLTWTYSNHCQLFVVYVMFRTTNAKPDACAFVRCYALSHWGL